MSDTIKKTGIPELTAWGKFLKSGQRIFIGSNAATPHTLMQNLLEHAHEFHDIEVVHILTLGSTPWSKPKYKDIFRVNALFLGPDTRAAVSSGEADYTPCFLSEVPSLFINKILPIDVALVQVTPPDAYGFCSLGVSVDVVSAACRSANYIVAEINPNMPRTLGESFIHQSQISAAIWSDTPILELIAPAMDDVTSNIGRYVSMLIDNGATLQLGIGKIPNAVLAHLQNHQDLGLHTEMFTDGVLELMEKGILNNRKKSYHPGKGIASFCMGSRRLYDYIHENPHLLFYPSEYTNNPAIIAKNDNMVAINSAIEVDLTGQVAADSMGGRFYSGIGGQVDFIRGAAMSRNGKPIIALPSTAKNGTMSRIVPFLSAGSGVVTSRGDIHYVVTEYGIATLRGKTIRERALELIQVAHPQYRDELLSQVRGHFWVPSYHTNQPQRVEELGEVELIKINIKDDIYFLRPLRPADERLLQEFFYAEIRYSLVQQYHRHPKRLSRERAQAMVNVPKEKGLALCIIERNGPKEDIQAVGRYLYIPIGNYGEVAFVVRATKRRKGMARTLLQEIIRVAKARSLSRLVARFQIDNKPLIKLLEKFKFAVQTSPHSEEIIMALNLETYTSNIPENEA